MSEPGDVAQALNRLHQENLRRGEPVPTRDLGPYETPGAALKQFAATTHMVPGSTADHCRMVLREALLLANVDLGEQGELEYLDAYLDQSYDPVVVQILAGWILRAHLAGIHLENT